MIELRIGSKWRRGGGALPVGSHRGGQGRPAGRARAAVVGRGQARRGTAPEPVNNPVSDSVAGPVNDLVTGTVTGIVTGSTR